MRPPSLQAWALLCTLDEQGQLQEVHGVLSLKVEVSCQGHVLF